MSSSKKREVEIAISKELEAKNEVYISNLEEQIKNLKRENERLRKQVNTVNFVQVNQEFLDYLEFKEIEKEEVYHEKTMKERWLCHACGRDVLYINILNLPNNQKKYYRACPSCNKKTKLKNFTDSVKGLFRNKEKQGIA